MSVFSSCLPDEGRAAMVKLSGSSRSLIFDSFIRLSNFFFATFSTCFLFIEVCEERERETVRERKRRMEWVGGRQREGEKERERHITKEEGSGGKNVHYN